MNTYFSFSKISPLRLTVAALSCAVIWIFAPELAQAAVTFGDIGNNVADSAKGIAKGITASGYAAGTGMAVWGLIDMYKASKGQAGQGGGYAGGVAKLIIAAIALGLGESLGSGSATLFGTDQTTGLDELGIR